MIPRKIHYIWVGPNPISRAMSRRIDHWRALHPDWEFRLWTEADIGRARFVDEALSVGAWSRASDYVRMDVLAREGGVYLDTDVDLLRPLDPLLDNRAFLGFQDETIADQLVNGAVLGAEAGHWLPVACRAWFDEQEDGKTDIGYFAGPGLLTTMLRQRGLTGYHDDPVEIADTMLYPRRFFYPVSWRRALPRLPIGPDTYAIHRWAASWVTAPSLRDRIGRFVRALRRRWAAE